MCDCTMSLTSFAGTSVDTLCCIDSVGDGCASFGLCLAEGGAQTQEASGRLTQDAWNELRQMTIPQQLTCKCIAAKQQ
jgi:hypothetical protein